MNIAKETITPKKAMQWLKRNIANRPLSARTVDDYASAMIDGSWKLNGDSIRFNGNGDLIDGQHRLTACVKSGKSFDSYVVTGLDHEAFDTIDQGKKRTISDVFARDQYKNYTTLASALGWVHRYATGDFYSCRRNLRPDQAHALLEKCPQLHWAVDVALRLNRQQKKMIHPGLLAFLLFETSKYDERVAEVFWSAVVTGIGLEKKTPEQLLNKRLIDNMSNVAKLGVITIAALSIKAWNAYMTKSQCGVLKWAEYEEFPTILTGK